MSSCSALCTGLTQRQQPESPLHVEMFVSIWLRLLQVVLPEQGWALHNVIKKMQKGFRAQLWATSKISPVNTLLVCCELCKCNINNSDFAVSDSANYFVIVQDSDCFGICLQKMISRWFFFKIYVFKQRFAQPISSLTTQIEHKTKHKIFLLDHVSWLVCKNSFCCLKLQLSKRNTEKQHSPIWGKHISFSTKIQFETERLIQILFILFMLLQMSMFSEMLVQNIQHNL